MSQQLLTHEGERRIGQFVERENRFVVRVAFDAAGPERVFLGDPGALRNVLVPGAPVVCEPVDDPDRATDYDAIAIEADGVQVSLRAALANDLFEAVLAGGHLTAFDWVESIERESQLPTHGRADFRLESVDCTRAAYVEVKSCTHVEDGVAKFPDRQTGRGRRHLRSLESLVDDGTEAHLVFVVQRPDVERVRPFRAVDPEFADLLARASDAGVGVHALSTAFDPPEYSLHRADLPVELDC